MGVNVSTENGSSGRNEQMDCTRLPPIRPYERACIAVAASICGCEIEFKVWTFKV